MTNRTASEFQLVADLFRDFRLRSPDAPVVEFLARNPLTNPADVGAILRLDIQLSANRGQTVDVANYFIQFPELLEFPELSDSIVDEDFKSRFKLGCCDDWESYHTGHPVLDKMIRGRDVCDSERLTAKVAPKIFHQSDSESLIGRTLKNYEVIRLISRGRRADVFEARDVNLDRVVALKISREISHTADREARFLAKLEHRNILAVHEEFELDSIQVIVMHFADGPSLAELIDHWHQRKGLESASVSIPEHWSKQGSQVARTAVEMTITIANAIQHAHERGVWHCDIKPTNVLTAGNGTPLLMDFDIAINAGTERRSPGGTIGYASPEQHDFLIQKNSFARGQIDHRTDVYSIGVVLFEMLTGRVPNRNEPEDVFQSVRQVPGCDRILGSIVAHCLQVDRELRYQNVESLRVDLQCWLDGRPLHFSNDHYYPERAARWIRRRPLMVATIGILLLIFAFMVFQTSQRLTFAERTLDQMEHTLEDPSALEAESFARGLIEVNAEASRANGLDFFFPNRRRLIQQRVKQVVKDLARLETFELLEASDGIRMQRPLDSSDSTTTSGSTRHLDQLLGGRIHGQSSSEEKSVRSDFDCELYEQALRELIELAGATEGDEWDWLQRRQEAALSILFPSMKNPQRISLLKAETALVTLEGYIADYPTGENANHKLKTRSLEWHLLGVAALQHGRVDLAKACFERGVALRFESERLPELASVRHLANLFLLEDNAAQSQKYLQMVRQLDPRDTDALHRLALVYEQQGELEQAISFLESAIELDPQQAIYHADLGAICIRAGRLESASNELEEAIALGYDQAEVFMNRAIVYYLNGSIGDAIASLEDVVNRFPADPAPRRLLSKLRGRD